MLYAQNRSEDSYDYMDWRDWSRALDVSDEVQAPSGVDFYSGSVIIGRAIHAHTSAVPAEQIRAYIADVVASHAGALNTLLASEIVTIPAMVRLHEPTWLANLKDSTLSSDTKALSATVRSILECIKPENVAEIDRRLESVDVSAAAPSHLLAVLSSLFTWRNELTHWSSLRDRAYAYHSDKQTKGVDRAFKGLM